MRLICLLSDTTEITNYKSNKIVNCLQSESNGNFSQFVKAYPYLTNEIDIIGCTLSLSLLRGQGERDRHHTKGLMTRIIAQHLQFGCR